MRRLIAFALALTLSTAAAAAPARYELDPEHTGIGFLVHHLGYAKVIGLFREASGSFTFDDQAMTLTDVRIVIKADSVFTSHEARDDHLRGPDFLDARQFPELVFTARTATRTGERTGRLDGELTLLGRTRPVSLDLVLNKIGPYPFPTGGLLSLPNFVVGVSARGSFKRSEFGMTYGVDNDWVGDTVELMIEIEAIRR